MDINQFTPLVLYDDQCYLCTKFAKIVNFLAGGKISIIGHYSNNGFKIRKTILDESALEMFWFVDNKIAYGGRAALIPLIKSVITSKKKRPNHMNFESNCVQECKTVKSVFLRSASLLSHSKKIVLK